MVDIIVPFLHNIIHALMQRAVVGHTLYEAVSGKENTIVYYLNLHKQNAGTCLAEWQFSVPAFQ